MFHQQFVRLMNFYVTNEPWLSAAGIASPVAPSYRLCTGLAFDALVGNGGNAGDTIIGTGPPGKGGSGGILLGANSEDGLEI